jgi:hypothetical protein
VDVLWDVSRDELWSPVLRLALYIVFGKASLMGSLPVVAHIKRWMADGGHPTEAGELGARRGGFTGSVLSSSSHDHDRPTGVRFCRIEPDRTCPLDAPITEEGCGVYVVALVEDADTESPVPVCVDYLDRPYGNGVRALRSCLASKLRGACRAD